MPTLPLFQWYLHWFCLHEPEMTPSRRLKDLTLRKLTRPWEKMKNKTWQIMTPGVLNEAAESPSNHPVRFLLLLGTNYYKRSGLKQHKCIILPFWRPEVGYSYCWGKISVSRAAFPSGSSRGDSVSLPLPASRGRLHSLAQGPLPPSWKPATLPLSDLSSIVT